MWVQALQRDGWGVIHVLATLAWGWMTVDLGAIKRCGGMDGVPTLDARVAGREAAGMARKKGSSLTLARKL
jgi:hypothetical protein